MIKKCERNECVVEFSTSDSRKRYCSRSCAAKVNNKVPKRKRKSYTCPVDNCGKEISRGAKSCHKHRFRDYWTDAAQGKVQLWIAGELNASYVNGQLARWARNYLLEEAGHKCTRCGWTEINPKLNAPILTVDHIDGNWKNNTFDNLVVLCYNCHTLTPTFNALNIGNGAGVRGSGNRAYAPLV